MLSDDLNRLLSAPSSEPPRVDRQSHPKGWEAGVKVESDRMLVTTADLQVALENEADWTEAVRSCGVSIPDGWQVRLVEMRFDPAAWTRAEQGEDAVTKPVWRYRFAVEPRLVGGSDWDDLVAEIKRYRPKPRKVSTTGESSFVVVTGDTQIGKPDGDGTEGTVRRFLSGIDSSLARLAELRKKGHSIGTVYLVHPGDCIEGFNSQGGRLAFRNQLNLTEQIRVMRRLMLEQVKAFSAVADRVVVVVVPGNHDEAVRLGNKTSTTYDDSFAVDIAAQVSDALTMNDAFAHVSVVTVSRDELTVTLDISGTIVTVAHGHQFRKGAITWWANQAHGMQPAGDSTVLISGHFHHLRVEQSGVKTWFQCPAMDGGSTWFRHAHGVETPAGLLTMVIGGGSWADMAIL